MSRLIACLCALGIATSAYAEAPELRIELNSLSTAQSGCTLSFVVQNNQQLEIKQAVWEVVIFDTDGRVERLALFDFGALPTGRTRVRQFVIPERSCGKIGQVLFNGLHQCDATKETACDGNLHLSSRVAVELKG